MCRQQQQQWRRQKKTQQPIRVKWTNAFASCTAMIRGFRCVRTTVLALITFVGAYIVYSIVLMSASHAVWPHSSPLARLSTMTDGSPRTLDALASSDKATKRAYNHSKSSSSSTSSSGNIIGPSANEERTSSQTSPPPQPFLQPQSSTRRSNSRLSSVPKIVHVLWVYPRGTTFLFQQALSLLSIRKFVAPQSVFFWYIDKPTGAWWHFARLALPYLTAVPLDNELLGRNVNEMRESVVETSVPLKLLLKYGGIFLSLDVVIVKPIDPLLRYHLTVGFHDLLLRTGQTNFIMSVARSKVVHDWILEREQRRDELLQVDSVATNASSSTLLSLTRYPHLVHYEHVYVDATDIGQVADVMDHIMYDEQEIGSWTLSMQYIVDVREQLPCRQHDPNSILSLNSTRGQVFRYIYYGSQDYTVY